MLELWNEICQLASTIRLTEEDDSLIWQFSSNGTYNVQSLYKIINFRGIQPVFTSAIWDLSIPPRVQHFLWLLSKNKVLTRDNLSKRREVKDPTCVFCNEVESVKYLFFDCAVAKQVWKVISEVCDRTVGTSFESVGTFWLSNRRNGVLNIVSSAVIWNLWKLRNDLCFQRLRWRCMAMLLYRVAATVQRWEIICPENKKSSLRQKATRIRQEAAQVLWLRWP